jgi:hypothetical protein
MVTQTEIVLSPRVVSSTAEVIADIQSRFSVLSTRVEGMPLNETEQPKIIHEVLLDDSHQTVSRAEEDEQPETSTKVRGALATLTPRSQYSFENFDTISKSKKIDGRSSGHQPRPLSPNEKPARQSSIQKFLLDYDPSNKDDDKANDTITDQLHTSPTAVYDWGYLMETQMERTGPSVIQTSRRRRPSRHNLESPPIQEISTNPLWKRRLSNHQHLSLKRKIPHSPSRRVALEHRELAQQIQSMVTDFDYQALKIKAKQRKMRRQLEQN